MSGGCCILVDGVEVWAEVGQGLAAALIAQGIWSFGVNPVTGRRRGPFCGMGVCFECELEVDGQEGVRACLTRVHQGMKVRTIAGGDG